jgi:hypothetical protein
VENRTENRVKKEGVGLIIMRISKTMMKKRTAPPLAASLLNNCVELDFVTLNPWDSPDLSYGNIMQRYQDIGHLADFQSAVEGCNCIGMNSRSNDRRIGGKVQSVAAKSGDDCPPTGGADSDGLTSWCMARREDKVYSIP